MKRLFEIQTLSDYQRLGDPVSIIIAGITILQQVVPNLFGGGRVKVTSADWDKMFPGNGYWTVKLKTHLSNTIHWNVDLHNIPEYTRYFVDDNKAEICGGSCGFTEAFQVFTRIIEQEKFTGGNSPVGKYPGGWGTQTTNWSSLLLLGGGVLLVMTLNKKKKRR